MQTLLEFENFVNEINLENGRNYKISILEKYKDNENIKFYLEFIFNPYKITGISILKFKKVKELISKTQTISLFGNSLSQNQFTSVYQLLDYLLKNNTGTDGTLEKIASFMSDYNIKANSDLGLLLEKIIIKSLTIGVDVKTINKIMPNLIPTFSVQLANKYFDDPSKVNGQEFYITTKLDGNRIIAIKDNGNVKFYSRSGKEYVGLVDLEDEMSRKLPDGVCLDGELIILDSENKQSKDQFTETQKLARTKDTAKHGLCMRVFDIMTAQEFYNQRSVNNYSHRRYELDTLFDCTPDLKYFIKVPVLYHGTDTNKIIELLNSETSHGEEGVMINLANSTYQFDRTDSLLKVKRMNDIDLEVIGFKRGTEHTKNANTLGALIVDFNGNEVEVGSGISDELKDEIWNNQEEWLGRTIMVQYFEITTNKQGKQSLRFPVYLDWRDDK